MRAQDTLSSAHPSRHWVAGFTPDTLLIHNYTMWPVYLRLGDTQTAGPTSFHLIIPAATAVVLPVQSAAFSASLAVPPAGTAVVTADRVDLLWTADEVPPSAAQYSLMAQPGQPFPFALSLDADTAFFQFDVWGYPAYGLAIQPTPIGDVSASVSVRLYDSSDGEIWHVRWIGLVDRGSHIGFRRFFPTTARYVRIRLAMREEAVQGTFTFILAPVLPERASYTDHTVELLSYDIPLPVPLAFPWAYLMNVVVGSGTVTGVSAWFRDFPLTSLFLEPYIDIEYRSPAHNLTGTRLQNRSTGLHPVTAGLAQRQSLVYNESLTAQTAYYYWPVELPITDSFTWTLFANNQDDVPVAIPVTAELHVGIEYRRER